MKRCTLWAIGFIFLALYFGVIGMADAETEVIPRVTNFIILADESGSMFEYNRALGKTKARLSKEILLKMNEKIPDMELAIDPEEFLWMPTPGFRRLSRLPLRWSPEPHKS